MFKGAWEKGDWSGWGGVFCFWQSLLLGRGAYLQRRGGGKGEKRGGRQRRSITRKKKKYLLSSLLA